MSSDICIDPYTKLFSKPHAMGDEMIKRDNHKYGKILEISPTKLVTDAPYFANTNFFSALLGRKMQRGPNNPKPVIKLPAVQTNLPSGFAC